MNIEKYCNLMEEVKKRTLAINGILSGKYTTSFKATNIEFVYLQLRKILEIIALSSLVANKNEFEKREIKFEKFWNPKFIIKDIERLNPDFYPKPVKEIPSIKPNTKNDLVDISEGFLTKEEFVEIYDKCGKILHTDNPFGSKADLNEYEKQITSWMGKIKILLNSHVIKLLDDDNLYLIHMKEKRDNSVHSYVFMKR